MAVNGGGFVVTLTTEGGEGVKVALNGVAVTAQQAAKAITNAYNESATSAEKAADKQIAAAERAEAAERRRMVAAAQRISDNLDPAAVQQRNYDRESSTAASAMQRGLITQAQYDAYLVKLKRDLIDTTNGLREHGGVLGLNRMQYLTAQSAVLRFTDSIIAGQSPLRAFALEAHKGVEIMAMGDGGMAGALSTVAGWINPVTIGLAGLTAAVVAGTFAAYQYAASLDHMEAAATGFGRTSQLTGEQLMQLASANAANGQVSVSAARDIEGAILQQTRTSGDALGQAIRITQKFADAMGIDAKKAAEDLGKAMVDPAKSADELAAKYGYLTQAQVEHIHELMEENRLTEAQSALLKGLGNSLDAAGDHVTALTRNFRELKTAMAGLWDGIGAAASRGYAVLTGQTENAEKMADLAALIRRDQGFLTDKTPGGASVWKDQIEARLRKEQMDYTALAAQSTNARNNQLGAEAREITGKYGLDPKIEPKLETLKQDLAKLEEAQKAGQHVDANTLDALHHAVRTFMTPEQQRIAEQTARADMRRAAPHSAERQAAAQRLMDATTAGQVVTEAGAAQLAQERGLGALGHEKASTAGAKHAETLAREAASMEVAARASLTLAGAYLTSGAAALKAEAYRKAATDATRKGIDIDAQAARQLNLMVAEQVANSAKTIRTSEDETAARNHVVDQVRAGLVPARDMDQALARENVMRPLLTLQAIAHGNALKVLTGEIARYQAALDQAHAADRAWAAQQAINAANDNSRADRARGAHAGVRDPAALARLTAFDKGTAQGFSGDDTRRLMDADAEAAKAKQQADSAQWIADAEHRAAAQQNLLELQRRYASSKDQDDNDEIARAQLLIEIDDKKLALTDEQIAAEVARRRALKDLGDEVSRQKAGWQQLHEVGANALDQLLNADNINHWGSTFHSVLRSLLMDLEKLALLNPLENMIFGGNRATLGSAGGGLLGSLFGSIFGSGAASTAAGAASADSGMIGSLFGGVPAFAAGTDSAPGGLALVGEYGPEIVNLPRGAGVMTASESRNALQSANGGNSFHMPITINAQGAGPREVDALRLELTRLRSDLPALAVQASNDARARRVTAA